MDKVVFNNRNGVLEIKGHVVELSSEHDLTHGGQTFYVCMVLEDRTERIPDVGDDVRFLPNFDSTQDLRSVRGKVYEFWLDYNFGQYSARMKICTPNLLHQFWRMPEENKFEPEGRNRLKQIDDFDIIQTNGDKMQTTLFKYLNLEEVGAALSDEKEPGYDDISFLIEVAGKMPRTPEEMEDFAAPYIASISLNALYRCNELKARATVFAGNKVVDLNAEYGRLIETSEKPATITKEISKSKPTYIQAAKESEKAKAYVEFYTGLSANFEKCHYWAKSREIANNQEFKGSAYEPHDARTSVKSNEGAETQIESAFPSSGQQKKQATPVEDISF